jgi:TorA maturation chaperone TorD
MTYELQHLYRTIERDEILADEIIHVDQILNIINQYQGADLKNLRDDYVILFSSAIDRDALCPLLASDFLANYAKHYDPDQLSDLLWESGIQVNLDEPVDSIINLLEYSSLLSEDYLGQNASSSDLNVFFKNHILLWIPQFCDVLYTAAQLDFYREVASGLKSYILWLE